MTKQEAIEILVAYNKWRRGDEFIVMPNVKSVGKAIDVAVEVMKGDRL